jgi:hypothetical protein
MSSEHWLDRLDSGRAILVEENDGWTYLRRGPEQTRTPVIITDVDASGMGSLAGRVSSVWPAAIWCCGISPSLQR